MMRSVLRGIALTSALLCACTLLPAAPPPDTPQVQLRHVEQGPREMEPATQQSITRAYSHAWQTLAAALNQNRDELLDAAFVGGARDKFAKEIQGQIQQGLRRRYIDHGHTIDVLFYSPDGLSVQLRDRAQLEIEILDGDSVVHREQVTLNYVALLSPTEVTWKVRALQAVPE